MTPLISALEEHAQEYDAPPQAHAEEEEEEGRRRPQVRGGARQVRYYIMRAHTAAINVSAFYYYICVRLLVHMRARSLAAGACTLVCIRADEA